MNSDDCRSTVKFADRTQRTITLIIDCSKIPPAATHGLPGSATVSSTNARTLEATIITDTERCLGDNHAILQDADSIYELVPSGCRSIEVNYKDAQALDPELPAYDDCRDDDGEPGRECCPSDLP